YKKNTISSTLWIKFVTFMHTIKTHSFMKRIKIFSLGGTISASVAHQTDYKDYKTGVYGASLWKETLPELSTIADINWEDLDSISSAAITRSILLDLRNRI